MVTIDEPIRLQSIRSAWTTNICLKSPRILLGYQKLLCELFDAPWNLKRGESTHILVLPKHLHVINLDG
jgi:hypothetical protein